MGEYDEAVDQLRKEGHPLADVFDRYTASQLRKEAAHADALEKRAVEAETGLRRYKASLSLKESLEQAGVAVGKIRKGEMRLLLEMVPEDGNITEDFLAQMISENQLPMMPSGAR